MELKLDFSSLVSPGVGLKRHLIPAVHYDPQATSASFHQKGRISWGIGGQIYRTSWNNGPELIPDQRLDSHWVDSVIQTVATNESRARPANPNDRWFYHQAGTYSRGDLEGKPQFNSPLLWNKISRGSYSSFNLAQQAHVTNSRYIPDRFLVFSNMAHIGGGIIEVVQVWFNHSKENQVLDSFNFPWAILKGGIGRYLVDKRDVTNIQWPYGGKDESIKTMGIRDGENGFFIVPPKGTFRFGYDMQSDSISEKKKSPPFIVKPQRVFIFSHRASHILRRGEALAARYYLVYNPVVPEYLFDWTGVAPTDIPESFDPRDQIGLEFFGDQGRLRKAPLTEAPIVLSRKWSSTALPIYEVFDSAINRFRYSTDPYLGGRNRLFILDERFRIKKVIGWSYSKKMDDTYRPLDGTNWCYVAPGDEAFYISGRQ